MTKKAAAPRKAPAPKKAATPTRRVEERVPTRAQRPAVAEDVPVIAEEPLRLTLGPLEVVEAAALVEKMEFPVDTLEKMEMLELPKESAMVETLTEPPTQRANLPHPISMDGDTKAWEPGGPLAKVVVAGVEDTRWVAQSLGDPLPGGIMPVTAPAGVEETRWVPNSAGEPVAPIEEPEQEPEPTEPPAEPQA